MVPGPALDEIIVWVETTPMNIPDIGVLLGPATLDAAEFGGTAARPVVRAEVPMVALPAIAMRLVVSRPVAAKPRQRNGQR